MKRVRISANPQKHTENTIKRKTLRDWLVQIRTPGHF